MLKFEVGKKYSTHSICDQNCIISVQVLARTAKTITAMKRGNMRQFRISIYNGVESVKPWGSYSMAPIVTAEKTAQ